jgi:hypothetical protein
MPSDDRMNNLANAGEVLADANVDAMLRLLRELGVPAEIAQSNTGDPLIRFRIDGYTSGLYFYGECEGKPGSYRSIQFAAMFSEQLPLEKANRWNRERRHVKVYADSDGQLAFEQDVPLDGGVTRRFLAERVMDWQRIFPTVLAFVSKKQS